MPMKSFRPTTPSRRQMTIESFDNLTDKRPEKSLTRGKKRISGRNNHGRITMRRRGGGAKRLYRIIDFLRDKDGVPARVEALEYDPNRTCRIALLLYRDGERRYIIAPAGLAVGQQVISGKDAPVEPGNCKTLADLPVGTVIHAVELVIGRGAALARSAGASVQLVARAGGFATLRLPSGEMRRIHDRCRATIGSVGNEEHENVSIGNAGRSRHMGLRPKVRGVVMNPCDHPHGGGEGRAPAGNPHPVSPWGQKSKGLKTRKTVKGSDKYIVKRRR